MRAARRTAGRARVERRIERHAEPCARRLSRGARCRAPRAAARRTGRPTATRQGARTKAALSRREQIPEIQGSSAAGSEGELRRHCGSCGRPRRRGRDAFASFKWAWHSASRRTRSRAGSPVGDSRPPTCQPGVLRARSAVEFKHAHASLHQADGRFTAPVGAAAGSPSRRARRVPTRDEGHAGPSTDRRNRRAGPVRRHGGQMLFDRPIDPAPARGA